jgi:hypothetical protein
MYPPVGVNAGASGTGICDSSLTIARESQVKNMRRIVQFSFLLGLFAVTSGCIVPGPREGFYDRDHARYYHEHAWHPCSEHGEFCR